MIVLDATTKSIEAVLAAAVATTQLPIMASYVDVQTSAYAPGASDTATNSTTGVTAVPAPAASTQRQVKLLTFFNADTAPVTITVRLNDNATLRTICKVTLAVGSTLLYTDGEGFRVLDASGNILSSSGAAGTAGGGFTVISNTATGATNNWAPAGLSGNTVIEWNGAADIALTGLAGGVTGQIVIIKNITPAKLMTFAHLLTSTAGNQFTNFATSAATPVFTGGSITFFYDGTNWKILAHDQGAWIVPVYAAGDFTASGAMTWTVDAGDVRSYRSRLSGRTLFVEAILLTTTTGGTASTTLYVKVPGGFSAAAEYTGSNFYFNTVTPWTMGPVWVEPTTLPTKIQIYTAGFGNGNWTLGTNSVGVYANLAMEVL